MIRLYQFARSWGIPNLSHFCVKVETYLRMAELPYEIVASAPPKAPKGKLPFIEDNGKTIADSAFILDYLRETYGTDPDAGLSAAERAVSTAMASLIEDHLYWISMYTRWCYTGENWRVTKKAIFHGPPPVVREAVAAIVRFSIRQQIRGTGILRHEPDEIFKLGRRDLDVLSAYLDEKPYFMGQDPTTLDAVAYGFLTNIINCPIESPLKDYGLAKGNLAGYCERMRSRYFPELARAQKPTHALNTTDHSV